MNFNTIPFALDIFKSKYFTGIGSFIFIMLLSSNILKLKYAKLRCKKIYPSIRNSQKIQLKSISTRLRFFSRRLPQIWQWRRNRKAFRIWRQMRYTHSYNVHRLTRLYQRSNFRLNRVFTNYLNWRLNTSFNLLRLFSLSRRQNNLQTSSKSLYSLMDKNIGNILMLYGILRNQHLSNGRVTFNMVRINDKQINSTLSGVNSIISWVNSTMPSNKYKGLTQETSQLLNVVLQSNHNRSFYLKYNPRLQRSLNAYYSLHNI